MPRRKDGDTQIFAHVAVAPDSSKILGTPNEIIEIYNSWVVAANVEETWSAERQLAVPSKLWPCLEDKSFEWTTEQTQEAFVALSLKLTGMESESIAIMHQLMHNPGMPVEQQPAPPVEPKTFLNIFDIRDRGAKGAGALEIAADGGDGNTC